MTDALLIVANALLLTIALAVLYDLIDRNWMRVQGKWLAFRRRVFRR